MFEYSENDLYNPYLVCVAIDEIDISMGVTTQQNQSSYGN